MHTQKALQKYYKYLEYTNFLHIFLTFLLSWACGVGGLPLRCPPSSCGLFATSRPSYSRLVSQCRERCRPARKVLNAGVAGCLHRFTMCGLFFLLFSGVLFPAVFRRPIPFGIPLFRCSVIPLFSKKISLPLAYIIFFV
jgi:hypothetical protein